MKVIPNGVRNPKAERDSKAREVLAHLNAGAGRSFRDTPENLKLITCRLAEVRDDVPGVLKMLDRMILKWKTDEKMAEFLRPATLFGKTNFSGYYDVRDVPVLHPKGTNGQSAWHAEALRRINAL